MQTARHLVGIDIGGTKIRGALATETGEILAEVVVPTESRSGSQLVDQVAAVVDRLGEDRSTAVVASCIAGPGAPNRSSGSFDLAHNIPGLESIDLAAELTKRLGHSLVIENDVNAAIIGEWRHGHGAGIQDFAFIALGTGVGMGLIANGRLVRGAHEAAGEIGYLPLGSDPYEARNQVRGPLEEAIGGHMISARYRSATGRPLDTPEVFSLAPHDDAALEALTTHARYIAEAVLSVVAVADPALVVLGGGVGARPLLTELVRGWLTRLGQPGIDLRTSALGERTAVVGALQIAREHATSALLLPEPSTTSG